jgi:hypothetical protein
VASGSLPFRTQQSPAWLLDRRYHLDTPVTVSRDEITCRDGESPKSLSDGLRSPLPRRWVTSDDVFADIGCGKGRIVVRASRSL